MAINIKREIIDRNVNRSGEVLILEGKRGVDESKLIDLLRYILLEAYSGARWIILDKNVLDYQPNLLTRKFGLGRKKLADDQVGESLVINWQQCDDRSSRFIGVLTSITSFFPKGLDLAFQSMRDGNRVLFVDSSRREWTAEEALLFSKQIYSEDLFYPLGFPYMNLADNGFEVAVRVFSICGDPIAEVVLFGETPVLEKLECIGSKFINR
ncbi:MAG: hypothetical protein ACRDAX_00580 [Propionibacteriaceae bacterium]